MYIDTHAHLTFPQFKDDLDQIIARAKEVKLETIINIALGYEALEQSLKIAEKYPNYVFTAFGLHPHEAKDCTDEIFVTTKKLALDKKIVAIGEMGLDYFYKHSPPPVQQEVFRKFLRLAQELNLPTIIHIRDASAEAVKILKEENNGNLKGVLHCFGGDMKLGQVALDMGLLVSFTGTVTFPKANQVREAAKQISLDKIMIETDCPFLAPQAFRGQRNEPAFVVEVAKKLAEVKGVSLEEIAKQTSSTAQAFFKL
ncbi:hydrolase TatD [Candidatus Saganbacteria bacterium CG08_land_8_20_14_0_20_45_16]|uniref:Hydrolase TatD n=1 Tax=Candidatus Saganbacteria bacterium CG08_land_8_20_14_0_20_45_16 TaxID=2014293 RepID=A0A2H0Y039_UNCSA|nr:MAG: hydrolase TatD [Candidatus Saganbacteria bacterium CG08_land_8_20_14_0_20_45_16]